MDSYQTATAPRVPRGVPGLGGLLIAQFNRFLVTDWPHAITAHQARRHRVWVNGEAFQLIRAGPGAAAETEDDDPVVFLPRLRSRVAALGPAGATSEEDSLPDLPPVVAVSPPSSSVCEWSPPPSPISKLSSSSSSSCSDPSPSDVERPVAGQYAGLPATTTCSDTDSSTDYDVFDRLCKY